MESNHDKLKLRTETPDPEIPSSTPGFPSLASYCRLVWASGALGRLANETRRGSESLSGPPRTNESWLEAY